MLNRIRDQRGVAMVTVLLVASVLTVTASAATVMTIREFGATGDDRQSFRALALAESGIDRMIVALKKSVWEDTVRAGCTGFPIVTVQGSTADGSFVARASRADLATCPSVTPSPKAEQQLRIVATGTARNATRRVEQMVDVVSGSLPVGIFAHRWVDTSGAGSSILENISVITPGDVINRDKMDVIGWDLWYSQRDIYGPPRTDTVCNLNVAGSCNYVDALPAAVHAGGLITCSAANRCNNTSGGGANTAHAGPGQTQVVDANTADNIRAPNLVCTADSSGSESTWDGSGFVPPSSDAATYGTRGPTTGLSCTTSTNPVAPNSLFTADQARALQATPALSDDEYLTLKQAAQSEGIYCTTTTNCRYGDGSSAGNQPLSVNLNKVARHYVIYADFPPSGGDTGTLPTISFGGNQVMSLCTTDRDTTRTATVIARYGNVDFQGGADLDGAVIAEVGRVTVRGSADINGTVIAKEFDIRGDRSIRMNMCTLNSLAFPFMTVSAGAWREIDR